MLSCFVRVAFPLLVTPRITFAWKMLVGGVIVDHQVDIQIGGNTGLQAPQERQELLMTMAGFCPAPATHAEWRD